MTTLIETNGHAGPQAYLPFLENLDMAIVDLKAIDPQRHRDLTGGELAPTLETRSVFCMKEEAPLGPAGGGAWLY